MARVLLVSLVYEPDTVSTATIAAQLAQQLQALGHDTSVLTSVPHYNPAKAVRSDPRYRGRLRRPFRLEVEDGVRVVRCFIPQKPSLALRRLGDFLLLHVLMTIAVLRYFRDRDAIIVVSPPLTLAFIGMLARRLGKGRLIYNVQELWPDVPRELGVIRNRWILRALAGLEHWVYRSSDRIVPIGPQFAKEIVQRGGAQSAVRVIPNFVDTARIGRRDKANPLATEWGVAEKPVVLYAGNIGLTQDFDVLLRAAEILEPFRIHFLIVGGGAARAGLESRVRLERPANVEVRDFVPADSVSELYGLADVVVVPLKPGHDRTTTPSKIFSAMAAGRPIVACASAGTDLAETVVAARAGLVVPAGDPNALADGIAVLVRGEAGECWEPAAALAAAARHSPAAIGARYDQLLRSLENARSG